MALLANVGVGGTDVELDTYPVGVRSRGTFGGDGDDRRDLEPYPVGRSGELRLGLRGISRSIGVCMTLPFGSCVTS